MYSAPNLSSRSLVLGELPWDFKPEVAIPEPVRKDKKLRDNWINNPNTKHQCYTFNEAVNSNQRISKPDAEGGGNPVRFVHAFVSDYDAAQSLEKVLAIIASMEYKPNWIERTLSGHWRYIWGLESPLLIPGNKFYSHFMAKFPEFAFDPKAGMIAFDEPAWKEPNKLWTNGCEWHFLQDKLIPTSVTTGWLIKASQTFKFTERDFGTKIPLEIVKEKIAERYVRFKEWDTDFLEGSQGPTFWVEGSTSPKSAIIRENGIQTFSAHAAKGFYSWADLLGINFVKTYEAERLGRAVENIHFDGKNYWMRNNKEEWVFFDRVNIMLELKTTRKLSSKPDKDESSPVERALSYINSYQRVTGAGPMVLMPSGIIVKDGDQYLNTCNTRVMAPAEGDPEVWGDSGKFPFVSKLAAIIPAGVPFNRHIAYHAWAYQHALKQEPVPGQVLFICGPTDIGKTLWARHVIGKIFGGFADATDYLTGGDGGFNMEMWPKAIWNVDDATPTTDANRRAYFSHLLKRMVSNDVHRCNGKFLTASFVTWLGRIIVTLNMNEKDARMIPDLSISNFEKVMLLRTVSKENAPIKNFPERAEIRSTLETELPHFCRYLKDYQIPEEDRGANRYGIRAYHDPSLVEISESSNPMDVFRQIVNMWVEGYFKVLHESSPEATYWQGTPVELHRELIMDIQDEKLMRTFHIMGSKQRMEFLERVHMAFPVGDKPGVYRIYKPGCEPK